MAKLGEVCLINPKSCTLRDDTEVSFIPMTKVGEHGEFDASEIKNYSEVKKGFTNFQNGDILFAKITPCMENGKGAIAHNMKNGIGFGSTEFHVLRPDTDKITSEWLYYLTTWKAFRKEAERNMTGSAGQKRVPKTFLENYVVNLPDIDTQKSENKILRKVDDLIFLRKQQLAKLDELVKARFVEMFGDDIYPKVKVSRVCDFITKGTTPPNNLISEKYSSDKVPYLKVYNLSFTGKLLFDTAPQYVPENIHNGVLARSKVYPNDVLMNIVGPPLGKFALVTDEFSEWNINQAIAIFRAKEKVNPKYLLFALMQPEVLKPFLRQAVGIRQLNLSLAQCRDLEIPLPPLSLQSEFAAFVERVDQQKQTVQQSLEKLELMKKALMQEYFG